MSIQQFKNIAHLKLLLTKPGLFFMRIGQKFKVWKEEFFVDQATARFIAHNRVIWKQGLSRRDSKKVILIDWHSLPVWNIPGLFFANVLAGRKNAAIVSFSAKKWLRARAVHALYRSFNVREHLATETLSPDQQVRRDRIYEAVLPGLKSKEDVFFLEVNGYQLGMDIYESYLKEFRKPTVTIDDGLRALLRLAIGLMIYWEDYFEAVDVAGVVISHDCYVDYNTVCRIAYKKGVPVYLPVASFVSHMKRHHDSRNYFYSFKEWFALLSPQEQKEAKDLARQQLAKRFRGEMTAEMAHIGEIKNAAFQEGGDQPAVLRRSDRIKVLICTHCFYDNPHAYGGMLFLDFYEWLKFLVETAKGTDYDWYLKTHADPLPGTMDIIQEILGDDSPITIIPSKTKHHQLIKEGVDFVLTVYGTVAHEYPAFGVQVINAGYNPHVAYDFTRTPRSIEEYRGWLLDLKNLKNTIKMEEVYEFYFMYYYYSLIDDLFYASYRDNVLYWKHKDYISTQAYAFYLDHWDKVSHERTIARLGDFIDSGKKYLFSKGPVDEAASVGNAAYLS